MWSAHTHSLPLQKPWQRLVSVVDFKPCPGKQVRTKGGKWCADHQFWANFCSDFIWSDGPIDPASSALNFWVFFIRSSLLYKCEIDLSHPHTRRHFQCPSNFPWKDLRVNWNKISRKSLVNIPLKKSNIEKLSGKAVLWMKTGTLLENTTAFFYLRLKHRRITGWDAMTPPGLSSRSASVCVPLQTYWRSH